MYKRKVNILMSTYNGEKYIDDQINSILKQEGVSIQLSIRDDGSSDGTIEKISKYKEEYPEMITVFYGDNIGFANSFMYLVKNCAKADFYAFADQDDVWEKDKILNAVDKIDKNEPLLYASNLKVYDTVEKREYMLFSESEINTIINKFNNYCYISNPYGCTMVWNENFQRELMKIDKPQGLTHDAWLNVVAHYKGKLIFDSNSYIHYRVHGGNACGVTPKSLINKMKKYYNFYFVKKKELGISLRCISINKYFPYAADDCIRSFAVYKKGIFHKIRAFYNLGRLDVGWKSVMKYRLLMLFNKF